MCLCRVGVREHVPCACPLFSLEQMNFRVGDGLQNVGSLPSTVPGKLAEEAGCGL